MAEASSTDDDVITLGKGPPVILLQLFRRESVRHYAPILDDLLAAGYRLILPNPRGYNGNVSPLRNSTYSTLADFVADDVHRLLDRPAHVVGAAMAGCVARAFAYRYRNLTTSVTHISHGGGSAGSRQIIATDPAVRGQFRSIFDSATDPARRIAAIQAAALSSRSGVRAQANDYQISPELAAELAGLPMRTPFADWWDPGCPFLVIQGTDDRLAPIENAHALARELGGRVELTEIDSAGHMPVREKPQQVVEALLGFWGRVFDGHNRER